MFNFALCITSFQIYLPSRSQSMLPPSALFGLPSAPCEVRPGISNPGVRVLGNKGSEANDCKLRLGGRPALPCPGARLDTSEVPPGCTPFAPSRAAQRPGRDEVGAALPGRRSNSRGATEARLPRGQVSRLGSRCWSRGRPAPPPALAAGNPAAGGRGGPSRLRRPPLPPGRRSREVGEGAKEAETAAAAARPGSERAGGCMERPARLCGLWVLLLYAGRGGVAAPAGEFGPPAGAAGIAAERPAGAPGAEGRGGVGVEGPLRDSPRPRRQAPPAPGWSLGDPGRPGFPGSRAAGAAGREDDDLSPHFPWSSGSAEEPGAKAWGPKGVRGVGPGVSPVARSGDEGLRARGDGDQGPGVRVTRRGSLRGGSSEVAAVEGTL